MPKYRLYLEIDNDGFCAAHIPELMGLYVFSDSLGKSLRLLPEKVLRYRLWLKQHGENLKSGKTELEVKEIVFGICPRLSGNQAALFSFDLDPPTDAEIRIWLRRAQWNRQELKKLIQDIPEPTLNLKRKGKRSIREILHHVANCDWWYASRLNIKLAEGGPKETFARLDWSRRVALKALRNLTDQQRNTIFVPNKYCGSTRGEKWTARKVFRRLLQHEREHIENIKNILAQYPAI